MAWLTLALIGIAGGFASGLLGVGGGLIFVPLLVFLAGFDLHLAIGTSLAIIIPTAVSGVLRHGTAGMVDWKSALVIALMAVIGAWLGAGLSVKMDTVLLRRVFAVFLVFVAFKLFFRS